jgi:hypothetical protein
VSENVSERETGVIARYQRIYTLRVNYMHIRENVTTWKQDRDSEIAAGPRSTLSARRTSGNREDEK